MLVPERDVEHVLRNSPDMTELVESLSSVRGDEHASSSKDITKDKNRSRDSGEGSSSLLESKEVNSSHDTQDVWRSSGVWLGVDVIVVSLASSLQQVVVQVVDLFFQTSEYLCSSNHRIFCTFEIAMLAAKDPSKVMPETMYPIVLFL